MTGGQPVDGTLSVPQILQQVISEGAKKAVVVTDYPDNYEGVALPEGVTCITAASSMSSSACCARSPA
jgi:indolepyruvate ferredoxin oxidoreductase